MTHRGPISQNYAQHNKFMHDRKKVNIISSVTVFSRLLQTGRTLRQWCISTMHKITNLWKFELNRSSNLRDNNERKKKHPCHTKLCAFRWLISRPQVNLRTRNQIRGKLLLSRKLWHFRGSRFSQCFKPSTSPQYSSPRKVLC